MSDKKYRIVLCGANAYDRKYYFNSKFDKIPENIKEELHIICVQMLEALSIYFKVTFLHQNPADLLQDMDEEE